MCLDIAAVGEAEHIDAVGEAVGGDAADHVGAADHAASDIEHLECAIAVDDDVAVADEGEVIAHVFAGCEDEFEAGGVVGGVGVEGVGRVGEEVNVVAGAVVNEVEVAELNVLVAEGEGVGAVFLSLEVDRHLAHFVSADDSVVFVILWDIDLGAVGEELDLGQLVAVAEVDAGAVDEVAVLGEVEVEVSALGGFCDGEGQGFLIVLGQDEDALERTDGIRGGALDVVQAVVKGVVGAVDVGGLGEGVAHDVPAFPVGAFDLGQKDFLGFLSGRFTGEGEGGAFLAGIEVACAADEVGIAVPTPFVLFVLVEEIEVVVGVGDQAFDISGGHAVERRGDEVVVSILFAVALNGFFESDGGDGRSVGRGEGEDDRGFGLEPVVLFEVVLTGVDDQRLFVEEDLALGVLDLVGVVKHFEGDLFTWVVAVDGELDDRIWVAVFLGVVLKESVSSALIADEWGDFEVFPVAVSGDEVAVDFDEGDGGELVLVVTAIEIVFPVRFVRVRLSLCKG